MIGKLKMTSGLLTGNNPKLYGEFAALWFFLLTKDGSEERDPVNLPDWPSLCFDYRQNFGFAPSMIEAGRLPDMTTFSCSGVDLSKQREMEVCKQKAPTDKKLTHVCPRVPVHGVKLSAESAIS